MIALTLPANTPLPVIEGQWGRLPDGRIEARYTRYELALAEACVVSDRWVYVVVSELKKLDTEAKRSQALRAEARQLRGL